MTKLPRLSGREIVRALRKLGYEKDHQRGSHIVLRQSIDPHRLCGSGPQSGGQRTLRAIIREIGLTAEQFNALL